MNVSGYGQFYRTTLSQSAMQVNGNLQLISSKLLEIQKKMATGKTLNRPSDDPFGTVVVMQLQTLIEKKQQYKENVLLAKDILSATDRALGDVADSLAEAKTTGLGEIGATANKDTRAAAAIVIDSLLDHVLTRANSRFHDRYLFSGTAGVTAPFAAVGTAIGFNGNNESLYTRTDDATDIEYNITGDEVFGTRTGRIAGLADLDPTIGLNTDLRLLNAGSGVCAGSIIISDGTTSSTIDLSGARTMEDVINAINDGTPATTTCSINSSGGLTVTSTLGGADLTVLEVSNGRTARDLGILATTGGGASVSGADLDPKLSLTTELDLLAGGTGIDLASGLVLSNGDFTATLTFDDCKTMEDVLNRINGAGVYVKANIAGDGRTLEVVSLLHGPQLRLAETTGTTATDLGLRSFHASTRLADLNDGGGVRTTEGDDLRIVCRSGDTLDVDVSAATTIQGVIEAINSDADNAGKVLARLATSGNGIELVDQTVDAGTTFEVRRVNGSLAASDLGIEMSAPGTDTIRGQDTNGIRNESLFTHLRDLSDALREGDDSKITRALERIEVDWQQVLNGRALAGTKGQRMEVLSKRIDDEVVDAKEFLARTQDLDFASALVEYSTLEAAMEACLQTASMIVRMSLMDYLV